MGTRFVGWVGTERREVEGRDRGRGRDRENSEVGEKKESIHTFGRGDREWQGPEGNK